MRNEYMSAKEATSRWGITDRRVQALCEQGRIDGVFRLGNAWGSRKCGKTQRRPEETD